MTTRPDVPSMLRGAPVWAISCDFDGTITRQDVVQAMLDRFADPSWREVEADWEAGRIGSRLCLERQTRLLRVDPEELAAWVDAREVDPHAAAFFADCDALGLDVRIVSDGYDWVIGRVMARLGLQHVPVFANRLTPTGGGLWSVEFPHAQAGCASGACKCAIVAERRPRAHIGDGRSDVCVADASDVVFAKSTLLASRQARGLPSIAFTDFSEIRDVLQPLCTLKLLSEAAA